MAYFHKEIVFVTFCGVGLRPIDLLFEKDMVELELLAWHARPLSFFVVAFNDAAPSIVAEVP
jgi:hypothetical protein